jgi:hypothetical protein
VPQRSASGVAHPLRPSPGPRPIRYMVRGMSVRAGRRRTRACALQSRGLLVAPRRGRTAAVLHARSRSSRRLPASMRRVPGRARAPVVRAPDGRAPPRATCHRDRLLAPVHGAAPLCPRPRQRRVRTASSSRTASTAAPIGRASSRTTRAAAASSLGLFVTRDTYVGRHGRSLRLDGLEPGVNDRALERAIVMHGASYVGPRFIAKHGRLGRSCCPALAPGVAQRVIDVIRDGSPSSPTTPTATGLRARRFSEAARRPGRARGGRLRCASRAQGAAATRHQSEVARPMRG